MIINPALKPELPIKAAVLDGFRNVWRLDMLRAFKISYGAGNFENPGVGAGRKSKLINGSFKQSP